MKAEELETLVHLVAGYNGCTLKTDQSISRSHVSGSHPGQFATHTYFLTDKHA